MLLLQLLSQPSIDPAVHLADGSNLLHAAVDLILRDTPACSGEHVAVLIDAVRQRLTPRQLMADPSSGRLPPDQQFLHHRCPDGHTALYKVSPVEASNRLAADIFSSLFLSVASELP